MNITFKGTVNCNHAIIWCNFTKTLFFKMTIVHLIMLLQLCVIQVCCNHYLSLLKKLDMKNPFIIGKIGEPKNSEYLMNKTIMVNQTICVTTTISKKQRIFRHYQQSSSYLYLLSWGLKGLEESCTP